MAQEFVVEDENITTSGLPARPEQMDGADTKPIPPDEGALFPSGQSAEFRKRWADIQASFVDEPKPSVEKADRLVDSVIQQLAQVFACGAFQARERLEQRGRGIYGGLTASLASLSVVL
jgi:hypothetical protein